LGGGINLLKKSEKQLIEIEKSKKMKLKN